MSRESFEQRHGEDWRRAEALLGELEARRRPAEAADLPPLYRRVCQHLALVRDRGYGADLEARLNGLALRGHEQLYRRPAGVTRQRIGDFLGRDFPAAVRSEWRLVLASALLFVVPLLATGFAVHQRPELVYSLLPPEQVRAFEQMYQPGGDVVRQADSDVLMFGFYIRNNVGVAFRTFAGGAAFGLGSVLFLVLNGLFAGAAAGYLTSAGLGGTFYTFVIAHAALELTAIVLAGAAGLRLGLALVAPGRARRGQALLAAARGSLGIVYGMALMLVGAAFVEAFWSSSTELPDAVRYGAGAVLWAVVLAYLLLAGRGRRREA